MNQTVPVTGESSDEFEELDMKSHLPSPRDRILAQRYVTQPGVAPIAQASSHGFLTSSDAGSIDWENNAQALFTQSRRDLRS